jgi:hypothetical protein
VHAASENTFTVRPLETPETMTLGFVSYPGFVELPHIAIAVGAGTASTVILTGFEQAEVPLILEI